ncbi:MAG: hypothetical protein ACFB10_05550 [Salibacteraceae bacterium]
MPTTPNIAFTSTGNYWVWVKRGEAWFRSEDFALSDPTSDCIPVGLSENEASYSWELFPNPATDPIQLQETGTPIEATDISVWNALHRQMEVEIQPRSIISFPLDMRSCSAGAYRVKLKGQTKPLCASSCFFH